MPCLVGVASMVTCNSSIQVDYSISVFLVYFFTSLDVLTIVDHISANSWIQITPPLNWFRENPLLSSFKRQLRNLQSSYYIIIINYASYNTSFMFHNSDIHSVRIVVVLVCWYGSED